MLMFLFVYKQMKQQPTFAQVFTRKHLYKAAILCFKHKGNNLSILRIKACLKSYIKRLHNELTSNTYQFSGFRSFRKLNGHKQRNIDALYLKDSIVYKCLCQYFIIPHLLKTIIYDSVAGQKYKGLNLAIKRLKHFSKQHYDKYQTNGGCLIFDIKDFFENINHDILKQQLKIYDVVLRNFIFKIIDHNQLLTRRKKYKDNINKGLGLGNELSQLLALIYISPLDHYIKEKLCIKHYLRYVDDAVILLPDVNELYTVKKLIVSYLSKLQLILNINKTQIIDFQKNNFFTFLRRNFYVANKPITKIKYNCIKRKIKVLKKEYAEGMLNSTC